MLHAAVLLLGFSGIFGKLISLNEGLITWYRVFFSAIILFIVLKIYKVKTNISTKEKFKIGLNGMNITLSWLLFYGSIKYANISIGVICYSLASLYTAIFGPIINKTSFKKAEIFLSLLTLLGILCIFNFDNSHKLGIVLGVISPAFASLYTIYNEKLVAKNDSKIINYYQMIGGTIGLGILMPIYLHFFPSKMIIPSGKDLFYLILLASFCTVLLYVTFAEVLKKISAFTVNLSLNLEPIYAIIIAFVFFGEGKEVNFSFYIGLFLVLLSVALQTIFSLRKGK